MYDALHLGRIDIDPRWLRRALTALPLPRFGDGWLVLAVDVSPWLRSDAACCRLDSNRYAVTLLEPTTSSIGDAGQ
jgi:hypothetical protein